MRFHLLFIFLCLSTNFFGESQQFSFRHLTLADGLSNSHVNCIIQDHNGFIWIGTENGLNKYNGYDFSAYFANPNDSTALLSDEVFALLEDTSNNLWIGTFRGLYKYNPSNDNFIQVPLHPTDNNISKKPVLKLQEHDENHIWIATSGNGVLLYNTKNKTYKTYRPSSSGATQLSSRYTLSVHKVSQNLVAIGTSDNGFDIFDISHEKFTNYNINESYPELVNSNSVQCFYNYSQDSLLIGTRNGLFCFNLHNKKLDKFTFANQQVVLNDGTAVFDIQKDFQNRLWISTNGEGLICINPNKNKVHRLTHLKDEPSSILNENNRDIYEDRQGNLWVVSYQAGINILPNKIRFFENYNLFDPKGPYHSNTVTSIITDNKNNLWIGTDGGGLKYIDRVNNNTKHYYPDENKTTSIPDKVIMSLLLDRQKNLWIGSYSGGLSVFNTKTKTFKNYQNSEAIGSISNNYVSSLLQDKRGNIWVGTNGNGLNKYNPEQDNFKVFTMTDTLNETNLINNWINVLAEDNNGRIWIGTFWGLSVYDPYANHFINYLRQEGELESLSNNVIYSIIESSKNEIWVGTRNGLNKFLPHRNSFEVYTIADGLPGNIIYGIEEDNSGNLWLSTNRGLCKLNTQTGETSNYFESDGLQSNEFFRGSSYKSPIGEMFFGGTHGLNSFFPDSISEQYQIPNPIITNFRIFDQKIRPGQPFNKRIILNNPIHETNKITIKQQDNSFSFELAALDFILPEKNFYRFKMEGFDQDWKTLDYKQRIVTYTNLDAGTYVFKYKASSIDNQWPENHKELVIEIKPPWYRTWWSYALYYTLLLALLIFIWLFSINRLKLNTQIKMERLDREKSEELNQAKLRFFTNISHEFRTPITLIIGPLERLLSNKKISNEHGDTLRLILKNSNRLLRLVNQLMDLRKVETGGMKLKVSEQNVIDVLKDIYNAFGEYAHQKNIDFQFISEFDSLHGWIDQDKVDKIVFNLLSNAFKFTPKHGEIILSISQDTEKTIQISVKDSGKGISKKDQQLIFERFYQANNQGLDFVGTGVGLSLTKSLVEIHKGKIELTSEEKIGSEFIVTIPINEEIYNTSDKYNPDAEPEQKATTAPIIDIQESKTAIKTLNTEEKSHKILVVEDNFDLRKYIADELNKSYQVMEAENGKVGLEKTIEELPDIIISDVMMPEMDGLELCKQVKTNLLTNHIPVILLTAKTSIDQRIEGIEVGADSYIPKPFHPDHLHVRIRKLIELRTTLKQKFSDQLNDTEMEIEPVQDKFLQKITEIIKTNITDTDLNIESLSKKMGMSRGHLHRKIKLLTDKSPSEFVRIIRLNESVTLLKNKEFNISEISYMVGFNSPSYFTNCFKSHFKISPSEYVEKI